MRGKYIDFISAYCDRWCERCAFTQQCSTFAVDIALQMCDGNFEEAVQLAVGPPPPRTAAEARRRRERAEERTSIPPPTEAEMKEFEREDEEREARIDDTPLKTASERVLLLSRRWLADHAERVATDAPPDLADAIEVARWDSFFIHAKLHRAQSGLDEATHGRRFRKLRIQTDWNGSAKVALISITRSITAWEAIATATADPDARHVAAELRALQQELEKVFPNAWKFQRPGFDGVRRQRWWW
jgi:hypothetical protein